jgi:hypothetical protein
MINCPKTKMIIRVLRLLSIKIAVIVWWSVCVCVGCGCVRIKLHRLDRDTGGNRNYHRHSNSGPPFFLIWSLLRLWYGSLSGSISLSHLSIFHNISCYNSLVLLTFVSRSSCRPFIHILQHFVLQLSRSTKRQLDLEIKVSFVRARQVNTINNLNANIYIMLQNPYVGNCSFIKLLQNICNNCQPYRSTWVQPRF